MAAKLIQVTGELFAHAENAAEKAGVSVDYQLEFWARIGRSYVGSDNADMLISIDRDHQVMDSTAYEQKPSLWNPKSIKSYTRYTFWSI